MSHHLLRAGSADAAARRVEELARAAMARAQRARAAADRVSDQSTRTHLLSTATLHQGAAERHRFVAETLREQAHLELRHEHQHGDDPHAEADRLASNHPEVQDE